MNAGAFGKEMKDIVFSSTYIDNERKYKENKSQRA